MGAERMRQKVVQGCGSVSCALLFIFSIKVDMPLCVYSSRICFMCQVKLKIAHLPRVADGLPWNFVLEACPKFCLTGLHPLLAVCSSKPACLVCNLGLSPCLRPTSLALWDDGSDGNQSICCSVGCTNWEIPESGIGRGLMNKSPNRSASYRGLIFSFL